MKKMKMDEKIVLYLDILFDWNRSARLTAFKDRKEALRRGVEPSLLGAPLIPEGARVLDVGSGGGFPAVPIALARPDLSFLCTEPSTRKASFLREVTKVLGLAIEVEAAQVEAVLARDEGYGALTVRGVRLRRGLMKRLAGALEEGGAFLVWTGGDRLERYAGWMKDLGLSLPEHGVAEGAVTLLEGRVPRGTFKRAE